MWIYFSVQQFIKKFLLAVFVQSRTAVTFSKNVAIGMQIAWRFVGWDWGLSSLQVVVSLLSCTVLNRRSNMNQMHPTLQFWMVCCSFPSSTTVTLATIYHILSKALWENQKHSSYHVHFLRVGMAIIMHRCLEFWIGTLWSSTAHLSLQHF